MAPESFATTITLGIVAGWLSYDYDEKHGGHKGVWTAIGMSPLIALIGMAVEGWMKR